MARDSQLLALLKARELDEQRALQRRAEIAQVVDERTSVCMGIAGDVDRLSREISALRGPKRIEAVLRGDGPTVESMALYAGRLATQRRELEALLVERTTELSRAQERLLGADQEVVNSRVERKRVEKLLEERERLERIQGSALEESATDEFVVSRRREPREE